MATKPAFRSAFLRHRSLVPANGFYEWKKGNSKRKTPYFITSASGDPLAIAAIWSVWHPPEGGEAVRSCALVTVPAGGGLEEIHDRMPAVIEPTDFDAWLDPDNSDADALLTILRSTGASGLEWYPVSQRVNSPSVNDPDLIRPVES